VPTSTNRIQRAAILALAVCLAAEPAFAKIWQEGDFGQNEPRVYMKWSTFERLVR